MRMLAYILIGLIIFMYMNIEISSMNPCSAFSNEQSLCTSFF